MKRIMGDPSGNHATHELGLASRLGPPGECQAQFRHLTQSVPHDPPNSYGDCQRTCLAMVVGCDPLDVPHFGDERLFAADSGRRAEREWLRGLGLSYVQLPMVGSWGFEWVLTVLKENAADTPLIVSGKSPRGRWNHDVVVYQGSVFDPHPDRTGLCGPCFYEDSPDDPPWFWANIIAPVGKPFPASVGRNAEGEDPAEGLRAQHEHAVPNEDSADAQPPAQPSEPQS